MLDFAPLDFGRTLDMGVVAIPLAFWYSHWFGVLGKSPFGVLTITLCDMVFLPLIHVMFLIPYHILHSGQILNINLSWSQLIEEGRGIYL